MPIHATLRHYAWVIQKRSILILLSITLCSGITYVVSVSLPPTYQTTAIFTVNGNRATALQLQPASEARLVTSPEVLQSAAPKLSHISVEQLKEAINSSNISGTQIIEIRAQATNGVQAAQIANTVLADFIHIQQKKGMAQLQAEHAQLSIQINTTKQDLDRAQQRLDALQQEQNTTQTLISQQKSLRDTDQSTYNQLLLNAGQLQLQQLQVSTTFDILQSAPVPSQPSSPNIWLNTLLATGLSLLTAILLALLQDWLDTSIQTIEDFTQLSDAEALGQLPRTRALQHSAQLLDFSQEKLDPLREAFTLIGTNFQLQYQGQTSLLCTGLHKKTGTTTVTAQLATILAQTGMRVLLIDANLYRPGLHTIFNQSNAQGLTTNINDTQRFAEQPIHYPAAWLAQWKTYVPNLWLLPTGPTEHRPQLQDTLSQLIKLKAWLLGHPETSLLPATPRLIDIIILDTPPLEEGSVTRTLAAAVDASLLIVAARKTQRDTFNKALTTLQKLAAPSLGVVLNQHKTHYRPYFYGSITQQSPRQPALLATEKSASSMSQGQPAPTAETDQPLVASVSPPENLIEKSLHAELPETPRPWHSDELFTQAFQPKFSLPATNAAQRFTSLIRKTAWATARTEEEQVRDTNEEDQTTGPDTAVSLPSLKRLPIQPTPLGKPATSLQFRHPHRQDEGGIKSREQLT